MCVNVYECVCACVCDMGNILYSRDRRRVYVHVCLLVLMYAKCYHIMCVYKHIYVPECVHDFLYAVI